MAAETWLGDKQRKALVDNIFRANVSVLQWMKDDREDWEKAIDSLEPEKEDPFTGPFFQGAFIKWNPK